MPVITYQPLHQTAFIRPFLLGPAPSVPIRPNFVAPGITLEEVGIQIHAIIGAVLIIV